MTAPIWQAGKYAIWHQEDADYYQCAHEHSNAWHDIGPHCDKLEEAVSYIVWAMDDDPAAVKARAELASMVRGRNKRR